MTTATKAPAAITLPLQVKVRYHANTHTVRGAGLSASCTTSPEACAAALARKVAAALGQAEGTVHARQLPAKGLKAGETTWVLEAAPKRHTHGCCVDKACNDATCMELPAGTTCGDCVHCRRCTLIYGHTPTDTSCDWFPRRFVAKVAPAEAA